MNLRGKQKGRKLLCTPNLIELNSLVNLNQTEGFQVDCLNQCSIEENP